MAPIGEPINLTGVRPIFRKPEPILPNLPIQVPPRSGIPSVGGTIENPILRDLPEPPRQITKPPIGRPIPPISIGGIGGIGAINPINIGQPVPSPIDRRPSPSDGVPSELLPIKGGPRPIQIQPIPRPIQPIDIPAPILPDPRDSIDRTLPPLAPIDIPAPILPDPRGGIGRPIPPISIGGIGGGRPGLTLQPPVDDPLLRPRVDASPTQELIPQVDESGRPVTPPSIGGIGAPVLPSPGQRVGEPSLTPRSLFVNFDGPPVSREEAEASARNAGAGRRPRGPIVGGMVPGGGGIDYGGGEGPPLLPDLRTNMNIETRDTEFGPVTISSPAFPVRGPIIPPTDPFQGSTISIPEDVFGDRERQVFVPPIESIDEPVRTPDAGIVPPPPDPVVQPPLVPIADPIVEPAPTTPAAVAPDVGAVPDATMAMGAIDPVLLQQATAETLTDPLIRSLYFGTQDSPGFFQQLQQAGANLIGQDVPLQQTAGLTPLELLARQQAVAGLGGFEPFLQQNRNLVNQAIAQSRRAEQLQDPYYTQAEQIYQDTMGAYDPSMTQQFFNPFEDAVVQQTISDVLEAGEQQDIAARAREIGAGAFGGSRARLGAMERREALGEGLAQALGRIRQQGFSEAQRTGLGEFARQQQAKRTGAEGLIGIGTGRGSAAGNLAQRLAGFGGQMTDLGRTQEQLRSGQRRELAGFGATGRGIAETGLGRIFEQQIGQQFRPLQTLGQIGSMLPGYQASKTQIDSQYGMPTDPTAAGLGAAFSAYGALAPRQGSS